MLEKIKVIKNWLGTGSINFFGLPFAGKDTQCNKLTELFNAKLVGSGEILRSYHDQGQLNRIMATGKLIPTELYQKIVLPYFAKPEFKHMPLILSAVGRMQGEEAVVMEAAKNTSHPIKAVVILKLSEDEVISRFDEAKQLHDRGKRPDDGRNILTVRLHEFKTQTIPVLEYYRNLNLLVEVDGSLSRDEVTSAIIDKLFLLATTK